MAYLVDTSVLGRLANRADVSYPAAVRAVVELHQRGEDLTICPQNLIEFRSAATRPVSANGLGLTSSQAATKMSIFQTAFTLIDDNPAVYPAWKDLVEALGIIGKQVHDARLVVICHIHGISNVLSFNTAHFARMSTYGPGLAIVHPANV